MYTIFVLDQEAMYHNFKWILQEKKTQIISYYLYNT